LPVFYDTREHAEKDGGLLSYGPNYADLLRRAATYVDRIRKALNPAIYQ
jgi:putative tryptophan/tyrosine transport system substrate-binding protein